MELLALPDDVRTAVLVEGASDREAVQEAARLAWAGRRMRLAGLYAAAEARYFERALSAAADEVLPRERPLRRPVARRHILLAILRDRRSPGARILVDHGITHRVVEEGLEEA
jgi:hypothetical protein